MNNMMIEINNAITRDHSGKMTGFWSLSTSCIENTYCQQRHATNNTVCQKCYAWRQLTRQKTTRKKMARNTELFTQHTINPQDVPYLNCACFRFESFGEIQNTLQVKNYFTICEQNAHVTFALWTKNAWIIKNALREYGISKPDNLIIIASMPDIDPGSTTEMQSVYDALYYNGYDFIDKLFCVYSKAYATANDININCGSRDCMTCRKCYTLKDDTKIINELLK